MHLEGSVFHAFIISTSTLLFPSTWVASDICNLFENHLHLHIEVLAKSRVASSCCEGDSEYRSKLRYSHSLSRTHTLCKKPTTQKVSGHLIFGETAFQTEKFRKDSYVFNSKK